MTNEATAPRILIADDQDDILRALRLLLKGEGMSVKACSSPEAALAQVKAETYDALILDLNYARDTTSGQEGLELIDQLQKIDSEVPIVVMTAWATVDLAVEAMQRGARDFVQKPWENERLVSIVRNQIALSRALKRGERLAEANRVLQEASSPGTDMIASSPAMQPVLELMDAVAESDAAVLITGENGTGKGVVAQILHNKSARAKEAFISVNMGGLPAGVFESEMFGHVKGAFTDAKADRAGRFELADGGTLFMDEIGNVPMDQQNKLLRLLETREFERVGSSRTQKMDVRMVSATNADLDEAVKSGAFRQDLLYRLNTITIHLPPLRERIEDIPLLADFFLKRHRSKYRREVKAFSDCALRLLRDYPWPGNVRELDHCIERAVLLAKGKEVQPEQLGLTASKAGPSSLDDMDLDDLEKYFIKRTLMRHHGNATEAAKALGLSRSAFYRRLQRHGL